MSNGIHKVQRVRIELHTVDATYEVELTAPDRIEPYAGRPGWRKEWAA